jgi:hypothetical protein
VPIVTAVIPASIGIAVLHNRLWDIDRVISRALAYTKLTATLAAIYVTSVILPQNLSGLVASKSSAPAIALSTLAVAALFGPLRRRMQKGIDRRFNRAKYDAGRTPVAFEERLLDEVDLVHLFRDLTSVVRETLHPEHVTPWLRETDSDTNTRGPLSQHGISIEAFALLTVAIPGMLLIVWLAMGALAVWRKLNDRGALLAGFFLAMFPGLLAPLIPLGITLLALILFGLLFPDGSFAPQWTRWLALAATFTCLCSMAVDILLPPMLLMILAVIAAQIHRFRSVSTWSQRQQTKWAILGLAAGTLGFITLLLAPKGSPGSIVSSLLSHVGWIIVISAIPVSIGISVLCNQLWDIDRIISRALAYSLLTTTLAAIYIGAVIGLQDLSALLAHSSSVPAIAMSTLVVAALFTPLRRSIQRARDRRFYRGKYDATRTVAAFGGRLRDEVDLLQRTHDLTSVVHQTLRPEHVSLWLREPVQDRPVVQDPSSNLR